MRYEVVEQKLYQNKRTGAQASIYGARPPWPADEIEIVKTGYSVYDKKNGTYHGRIGESKDDAQKRADKWEAMSKRHFI